MVHTCIRVPDVDRSVACCGWLGFEPRGRLNFDSAYNVYLGLPGGGDVLELTVNVGREQAYDLGGGYNHMALVDRSPSLRGGPTRARAARRPRPPDRP